MVEVEKVKKEQVVIEGDLTWSSEHTMRYTNDVLQNCTPETYVIL